MSKYSLAKQYLSLNKIIYEINAVDFKGEVA